MLENPPLTPRELRHHWRKDSGEKTRNHQLERMKGSTDAEAFPETVTPRLDRSATTEHATNSYK